jgi:hypothetical protein
MPKWKQSKEKQELKVNIKLQDIVFKRQFRWTFELLNIKAESVKKIGLPIATIDKGIKKWQSMVVEYYDICAKGYEGLWEYILQDKFEVVNGILNYYDGSGKCIHSLEICLKPKQIEISNPDYSSSNESTVKIYFDVLNILQRTTDEGKISKSKSRR